MKSSSIWLIGATVIAITSGRNVVLADLGDQAYASQEERETAEVMLGVNGDLAAYDVEPCGGDGDIDVDDILAELNAFTGLYSCVCPTGSTLASDHLPILAFTDATLNSTSSDAAKETACTTAFGSLYTAATGRDAAAQISPLDTTTLNPALEYVTVLQNTNRFYHVLNVTANASAITITETSAGSARVACIRKDAPIRFTLSRFPSTESDAMKDSHCAVLNSPGVNYVAANLMNVGGSHHPIIIVPIAGNHQAEAFTTRGNTTYNFYTDFISGFYGASIVQVAGGAVAVRDACIRR